MSLAPRFITFDCYGTLIDWHRGIQAVFASILVDKGASVDLRTLQGQWETLQFEMIQGPYRSYQQILRESLVQTLRDFDLPVDPGDEDRLVTAIGTWKPFPDSRPALERLRARAPLVIISNIDNVIIAESAALIGVPFHGIITAEMARIYKPSRVIFDHALRRLGVEAQEVLHVAAGFKYDIPPAASVGMMTCWVNRKGEPRPEGPAPDHEVGDLNGVVQLLEEGA